MNGHVGGHRGGVLAGEAVLEDGPRAEVAPGGGDEPTRPMQCVSPRLSPMGGF
jgi:hypothetical protein